MGIFSRQENDTLVAVFDIGGSSIGGAFLSGHPGKLPEILTAVRFPVSFSLEIEFKKFERTLHKTFERVIGHLKKKMPQAGKKPDLALLVFSSPYYVAQSKIIRAKKERPFEITDDFIKKTVDEGVESFKKKWQAGHSEQKTDNNIEIIEREIMAFRLNGYPVLRPIGKHCHDFEVAFYVSAGIKNICDKLKECVFHSFGETPVRFQTFPFVAFSSLKDILDIRKGLLLVDIGGETTDLVLIKNNILEETMSFPLGENFLIRRIAGAFHFPAEESSALLSQYSAGKLHSQTAEKLGKIIGDAGQEWCELFKKAGEESPDFVLVLQNRLLIGGKAALALKDFIICAESQPLAMHFLLPEAFKNHFIFKKSFNEDKDILLMLPSLFINNYFDKTFDL